MVRRRLWIKKEAKEGHQTTQHLNKRKGREALGSSYRETEGEMKLEWGEDKGGK